VPGNALPLRSGCGRQRAQYDRIFGLFYCDMRDDLVALLGYPTSCALDTVKGKIVLFQKTTNGFQIPRLSFSDVHRSSA
jgi:hypothetical protein